MKSLQGSSETTKSVLVVVCDDTLPPFLSEQQHFLLDTTKIDNQYILLITKIDKVCS